VGSAAVASLTISCEPGETNQGEKRVGPGPFELDELSILDLQQAMESGKYSARRITEMFLSRIEEIDRQGPMLRSIIEVNPDALVIAESLDQERKEKGTRGPLHGIPVVLKDNLDTADRMTTTAGSLALEGSIPPQDSSVARSLREAGAILLAKANLSEWANFRSERSSSGWSARGGQCRNPYALDRNPCGSSSGSAVAVSANLCSVAIGTETDGSIVCPSNANGVVGLKPTVGLVSRAGIIPISHTQDTAGPITRTVTEAAIVLGAITGTDSRDPATSNSRERFHQDYTQFLDASGLAGSRIGIARQYLGFHERVDQLIEDAIAEMKRLGAEVVDPTDIATRREFSDSEYEVLLYEFKEDLNAYLRALGPDAPVKTLEEIIQFNERNRDREMPFFEQEIFLKSQEKGPLTSKEYLEALEKNHRLSRVEGIDAVMDEHQLDAIVAPTGGPAWVTDLVTGDHFLGGSSGCAAVAGYPNITVPVGNVHGLPVGISFFGRAWSEPTLIKLAYAFEQATHFRRTPDFLATLAGFSHRFA
jgi:amidase